MGNPLVKSDQWRSRAVHWTCASSGCLADRTCEGGGRSSRFSAAARELLREPTRDVDQQHGSDSRHDNTPYEASGIQPESPEYEPAEHRTDNPEQQIHQHAVPAAAHQFASKPAGDDADDNL